MKKFLSACLILIALLGSAAAFFAADLHRFRNRAVAPPGAVRLTITRGTSLRAVAARLESQGVITDAQRFGWLTRWREDAGRIQAGEYRFAEPATPDGILDRLTAGDVIRYRVTIPEGWTMVEVSERLGKDGYVDPNRFLALARSPEFIRSLDLETDTLEGYLFPETYSWSGKTDEKKLLRMMVEEFRRRCSPELADRCRELDLTRHQLVTLASIIQKEAGNREEMPLISAVFHNRLKRGIPLQADPTVIYGLDEFDGNLTRRHLETPTPYNTYLRRGLPPGPIANPGEDALRAAANPADVNYLYFVAAGPSSHVFNSSLVEHNRAVRKYQLHRR